MPEHDVDAATRCCLAYAPLEWRHDAGAGTPRHVEPRHGIPRAARQRATSLRPADDWEDTDALRAQPRSFLAGGEGDVGFSPLPRPLVFGSIESGRHRPVLQRPVVRVVNPEAALLRR